MKFENPLCKGTLVRRYKRFLSDVTLTKGTESEEVVAHCANPGSMLGLAQPGSTVWLQPNNNPKAKLDWRWELTDVGSSLVCINTARANQVIAEALEHGTIVPLAEYSNIRREVPYGTGSRIDFLLEADALPQAYVEVKSVTLQRPDIADGQAAEFPDSTTKRGTKHLVELINVLESGARSIMLFLVQRSDCTHFRPAADIDPTYAKQLGEATDAGVEILCYDTKISAQGIDLGTELPVHLD